MAAKIKSLTVITARILLGALFFVFGLNYFITFLPTPPQPDGAAGSFTTGLFLSGYFFPFLKGTEVVLGGLLLTGTFVPLVLVILMPISLNILLFHAFLTNSILMAVVIVGLHLYLAWSYREYYKPLFIPKASANV